MKIQQLLNYRFKSLSSLVWNQAKWQAQLDLLITITRHDLLLQG